MAGRSLRWDNFSCSRIRFLGSSIFLEVAQLNEEHQSDWKQKESNDNHDVPVGTRDIGIV